MLDMLDPQLMRPQNGLNGMDSLNLTQSQPMLSTPSLDPSWGYDLNLLSHAASHVASNGHVFGMNEMPTISQEPVHDTLNSLLPNSMEQTFNLRPLHEAYGIHTPMFDTPDLDDPMQDFTVFLDSIGMSSEWDPRFIDAAGESFTSPELRNDTFHRPYLNGEAE
ncbi:hypothetical protein LTR66_016879, partial [Elasticomyces elasticus]